MTFALAGLYRSRLTLSLLNDFPYIVAAVTVGMALKIAMYSFGLQVDPPERQVPHAVAFLVAVSLVRWAGYAVVRQARSRRLVRHRTLILGADEIGVRLAGAMLDHPTYGLYPVGFVDGRQLPTPLPLPLLGEYGNLGAIIQEHQIRDLIVAFGDVPERMLVEILTTCDRLDVELFFVPRLFELHNPKRDTDFFWGVPLIRSRRPAYRNPWWKLKRLLDVTISGAALVLLSPVMALCAIAVRIDGGPGVIFRQERVGLDGRTFRVLKFRSMRPADENESGTRWNIAQDDRLGPIGRFLRASSLDELPQLWNVLRGDMSLVGPRPERPYFVNQFSAVVPRYNSRLRVQAGLTGWAQAHGLRGDTSIEDRARFDNYYIQNWSLWLDIKILIMTVGQVVRRQGG